MYPGAHTHMREASGSGEFVAVSQRHAMPAVPHDSSICAEVEHAAVVFSYVHVV